VIITCKNCNKKFEIDSSLIPDEGRLLQCGSCNHEWFFKKVINIKPEKPDNDTEISIFNDDIIQKKLKDVDLSSPKKPPKIDKQVVNKNDELNLSNSDKKIINEKKTKSAGFLNLIIVFLITFVALVILLDTFKDPMNKIIPNFEFILYNLYESLRDVVLFFRDLF
jgi:predicted Zn finger-like uncharacterized protein